MESEEVRIYNAAHLMVASLAGSLAHVTCKVHFGPVLCFNLMLIRSLSITLLGEDLCLSYLLCCEVLMSYSLLQEPLRGSISSQLRNMLQGVTIGSDILEQYVQLVTNDNLDLGCALIEQAATEKVNNLLASVDCLLPGCNCAA